MIDITAPAFLDPHWGSLIEFTGWCASPDLEWEPEPENKPLIEDRVKFGFDMRKRQADTGEAP
jgi:hypothetical protein